MWRRRHAPDLLLPPAQARVFGTALRSLSDFIGWEPDSAAWQSGWPVFDDLTTGQQQAALLTIAQALLVRDYPAPPVTAVLAAAVAATFDALQGLLETDLLFQPEDTTLRRRVLVAVAETGSWQDVGDLPAGAVPDERCVKRVTWFELSDTLRDAILDDADYELAEPLSDLEPGVAKALKQLLAIDPDYFVSVPEDPSATRLEEIRQELHGLLGREERQE
jgi:hypothetical protein